MYLEDLFPVAISEVPLQASLSCRNSSISEQLLAGHDGHSLLVSACGVGVNSTHTKTTQGCPITMMQLLLRCAHTKHTHQPTSPVGIYKCVHIKHPEELLQITCKKRLTCAILPVLPPTKSLYSAMSIATAVRPKSKRKEHSSRPEESS